MSAPPQPLGLASRSALGAPRAGLRASLLRGMSQVLASQAVLAVAGLATLPVLTRELGTARYGEFSLFVMLLGVVTYQDVARQLLIHEQARHEQRRDDLTALTRLSTLLIVALAALVGPLVLSWPAASALVLVTLLHGLCSRDYAELAVRGRVGAATAVRNFAWAGAFAGVALLSLVTTGPLVFALPFVVANAVTWLAYRRMASAFPSTSAPLSTDGPWWARASGWSTLRASPDLPRYRSAILDLLGFTLAASVIASLDRVLLERFAGPDELGLYCGAADVAMRIQIIGSALAATLYPTFARMVSERGEAAAARQFLRVASWVAGAYFAGLLILLALDSVVLDLLLGPAFASSRPLFALMLVGVFVHSFGYLLTPWQRARGDFASTRRAYVRAALVMLGVGVLTVPAFGATGAVLAYLAARSAELQLAVVEAFRLPSELGARQKLAAAGFLCVALGLLCAARFLEAA